MCRLASGVFADCGLTGDDIAAGKANYDDLFDYVKAFMKGEKVGHPYEIKEEEAMDAWLNFGQPEETELPGLGIDLPW